MNTKNTSENATIDRIVKGAFYHAIDSSLNEENKEAARKIANAFNEECVGNTGEVPEGSPLFNLAIGFILGMNEGLHVAEVIEECGE